MRGYPPSPFYLMTIMVPACARIYFKGKKNSSFINGKLMLTQNIVAIGS
jgi:hypothetical protein